MSLVQELVDELIDAKDRLAASEQGATHAAMDLERAENLLRYALDGLIPHHHQQLALSGLPSCLATGSRLGRMFATKHGYQPAGEQLELGDKGVLFWSMRRPASTGCESSGR